LGTYRIRATTALGGQRSIPPSVAHSRCRADSPPPSPASALRAALPPSPAPALRAALTPNPAPALRERGVLVSRLGIVDRRRRRIATATLTSPLPLLVEERKGARGKARRHPPPSSPATYDHGTTSADLDQVRGHPSPAAYDHGTTSADLGQARGHPPPSSPAAYDHGTTSADLGQVRGHPPPSSPAARERKGVGGKVRATRRARQYWPCNRCTPVPARRGAAYGTRHRSSDHYGDVMVKPHQPPRFLITL